MYAPTRSVWQVGQDTVPVTDAQRGACWAVSVPSGATGGAHPARGADLAYNAATYQRWVLGLLDEADELVTQHALKTMVPAHNLDVSVADSRQDRPDPYLTGWWVGGGMIQCQAQPLLVSRLAVKDEGSHFVSLLAAIPVQGGACLLDHNLLHTKGIVGRIPGHGFHDHALYLIPDKAGCHHSGNA